MNPENVILSPAVGFVFVDEIRSVSGCDGDFCRVM